MRVPRCAWAVAVALALSACVRPVPTATSPHDAAARLRAADAHLEVGCFDCLAEALREYEGIGSLPNLLPGDRDAAVVGVVRAALLLELRGRELGIPDEGYLQRAEETLARREDLRPQFVGHLATVESIPRRSGRFEAPLDAASLRRMQELRANFALLSAERRGRADEDILAAYGWIAFTCAHGSNRDDRSPSALTAPLPRRREAPIIMYRSAMCGIATDAALLANLLQREPRFAEIDYWLGQSAIGRAELQEAESFFLRAYAWRPRWPAVTGALGDVYFAFEEPARALDFYHQTLAAAPDHPDALLGRVKALSVSGRHDEAFVAIDAILDAETRVFPGEAYYWRAWNNAQLGRIDLAWTDVEEAARLWVNSEVSKLGGVIAYRRRLIVDARDRFEAARKLAPEDCETLFYLGSVQSELRAWAPSVEAFSAAVGCLERARTELVREIEWVEASTWTPDRKARQIARRESQLAAGARLTATSWFNLAAAHFNLGNRDDARRFAERVIDDEQFAARARDLLQRLPQ